MINAGNIIYNCGMYLRLSKEDELKRDESSSISSQRLIISAFANYNKLNIVTEYVDDGYSGGNFERPAFQKMLDDIEKGIINCVITKDLSRLGREMYGTGKYIEEYFTEKNIRYIAINDSFDSLVGDSMLGLRLSVNDLYLRDVSKKVKSSFRIKQQNGDYIGSAPCFGYKKDPENHHRLIIDEPAAKIVRYIFKLSLEGLGGRAIANQLNDSKIPTPNAYKNNKSFLQKHPKTYWTHTTVNYILKNRMYTGDMVQHLYEKVSYNSKKIRKVSNDEIIIVPNKHEPIISREDFATVQEKMSFRHVSYAENGKYLLSGLIHCGGCGRVMAISANSKKTRNCSRLCRCNFYNRVGTNSGCTPNRVNYDYLEEDVLNYIKEIGNIFVKKYDSSELVSKTMESIDSNLSNLEKKLNNCKSELKKEQEIINRIYNDRLEGIISTDMYKEISKSHEDSIQQLKKTLSELEIEYNNNLGSSKTADNIEICKKYLEEFLKMENPSKELMNSLIENIVVYDHGDEKDINVYFKFKELVNISNTIYQG